VYPRSTVDLARELSGIGVLDRENALICGVSIRSIRHWRSEDRRPIGRPDRREAPNCPRCHQRPLDEPAYAYLLGLYLGDGHIVHARRSYLLSLACADRWPGLLEEAVQATKRVMPSSTVFLRSRPGVECTYVQSVSRHWTCLFPQHGPGKKHERNIELESWQQTIASGYPGALARGLFHSDGYRGINMVRRQRSGGDRWYAYPRYLFTNYSADILRLCGEVLDILDVEWRFTKPTVISVARRDAVARLDEFVGPKY
jgi:hypothetical protein